MKKIFSLLLLIALKTSGQTDTVKNTGLGHSLFGDSIFVYSAYDTVDVLLLCIDTTTYYQAINKTNWTNHSAFWMRGYEVRKNEPSFDYWDCGLNACMGWRNHFSFYGYLGFNKKPCEFLVWLSKEIK